MAAEKTAPQTTGGNARLGRSDIAPSSDAGSIILRRHHAEAVERDPGSRALAVRPLQQRGRARTDARIGASAGAMRSLLLAIFPSRVGPSVETCLRVVAGICRLLVLA